MSASQDSRGAIDKAVASTSVLILAFCGAVVGFAIVGTVVAPGQQGGAGMQVVYALVLAAFGALVGSVLFRRISLQPARLASAYYAGGESALAQVLVRTAIVSGALAESVGIFGLIIALLTADTYYLYALCAVALIGVLSNFPRASKWRGVVAEIATAADAGAVGSSFGKG